MLWLFYLWLGDFSNDDNVFLGMSSTTANLLAYDQSSQTEFPKVVGVDKACQTEFPDISYFHSIKKEPELNLSDLLGSSSTTEPSKNTNEDYQSDTESCEDEEESEDEEMDQDEFTDGECMSESEFEEEIQKENQRLMCELTMSLMEQNLQHYTGINKESAYVVDLIVRKSSISIRNIMLILRKIRHNESFQILDDAFGISKEQARYIFRNNIKKLAECLKPFIYWPDPKYIKYNLPLQFKHKFRNVQIIIDCFEISISKPRKVVDLKRIYRSYLILKSLSIVVS